LSRSNQSWPPFDRASPIPKGLGLDVLVKLDGDDLETANGRFDRHPEAALEQFAAIAEDLK